MLDNYLIFWISYEINILNTHWKNPDFFYDLKEITLQIKVGKVTMVFCLIKNWNLILCNLSTEECL